MKRERPARQRKYGLPLSERDVHARRDVEVPGTQLNHIQRSSESLTAEDASALARLISIYGVEVLQTAIRAWHKVRRGRPKNPLLDYEKMSDAIWITDRIDEFRSEGARAPVRSAFAEFARYKYVCDESSPSQIEAAKKRFQEGRRLLARMGRNERK